MGSQSKTLLLMFDSGMWEWIFVSESKETYSCLSILSQLWSQFSQPGEQFFHS